GDAYRQLFPHLRPLTILNVFPRQVLATSEPSADKIRLFWFSQTVGPNRGIEIILEAMHLSKDRYFELHLLGNPANGYLNELVAKAAQVGLADRLHYYNPMPEAAIFALAASCDIGMASETGIPYNRNICLTNKIFTYIQSGLAVIASDTKAQELFFSLHPGIGKLYHVNDAASLANVLDSYWVNRESLYSCKRLNYELGQTLLNWETEQATFVYYVGQLFAPKSALSAGALKTGCYYDC
ncbi:MAG: glycosyltransferase, partial [Chitinophagaceae bacterium]